MELNIKLIESAEYILTKYDAEKLLTQGMNLDDYLEKQKNILPKILEIYSSKVHISASTSASTINLSDDTYATLIAFANNYNINITYLFNYLITNVCNCSKINTIEVDEALDFYYNAINHNKSLFSEILSKYSNSIYYNEDRRFR